MSKISKVVFSLYYRKCIPYRFTANDSNENGFGKKLEVLMISSQKGKGVLFPKGGWETDESLGEAAGREALEEAGVRGDIGDLLGEWIFKSKSHKDTYRVGYMFPLHVTEQLDWWPEKNVRERKWVCLKIFEIATIFSSCTKKAITELCCNWFWQVTVGEARASCQYLWMREALELLIRRTTRPLKSPADSALSVYSPNSSDDSSSSE
ncbi:Diphosphoinositol polyphosphate phosphohydrolase 2 [Nymphaea thermarum]|nr:Diphosphoinositol polyphosphate phosphohydrolase 2 [Nymphaea thermarum]